MAKYTQRPSVLNMTYAKASTMQQDYTEANEAYLRSIVRNHVPDAENKLACADRSYLLHMARTIKGVANKVLKSSPLNKRIELLAEMEEGDAKELFDERICLQMDSVPNGNYLSYLIKAYNSAKKR
jgi:hypothetical protein